MKDLQLKEIENISERKIYSDNISYLQDNFNKIFNDSEQNLAANFIEESNFLLKQSKDNSKTYSERYEIFNKISSLWLNYWKHYKNRPDAIELMNSLNHLINFSIAYMKFFLSLSLINEGKTGQELEDDERVISGYFLLAESIDVFLDYLSESELKQIHFGATRNFNSTNRNITEYFEEDVKQVQLTTQLRAYLSLIILKIEKYFKGSIFHDFEHQPVQSQNIFIPQLIEEKRNSYFKDKKWDLIVISELGQPILVVEIKARLSTSINWVTRFYQNLMEFWHPEDLPFFMMAFPDKFYLWRKDQLTPDYSPNYIIDATLFLQPYFTKTGIHPQCIHGESFELMVGSWLANILNVKTSAEDLDTSEQWLLESGLYQAISGGELRYDNGVDR